MNGVKRFFLSSEIAPHACRVHRKTRKQFLRKINSTKAL